MHPNCAFHWTDEDELLAFIADVSFATICVDGPAVVHVPVGVAGPDRLRFHVSRSNPALPRLDGARAIASVLGPDAYVSPDWYGTPDQVPTWNYLAVEAEGSLRRLDDPDLPHVLEALSAAHEARLAPKPPWTRGKMSPGRFEAMVKAIVGFELTIESLRGTRKLGQHKRPEERARVADALAARGQPVMAELSSSPPRSGGEGDHRRPVDGGGVIGQAGRPLHHPADGPPPHAASRRREERP